MRLLQTILVPCLLCSALLAQGDTDPLSRLERSLREARLTDLPGRALEYGLVEPLEVIAGLLASSPNARWERRISGLKSELAQINRRSLNPLDSARADALDAALQVERILISAHSSERWHALGFVRRMEHVLYRLSLAPPSADRYRALSSILEQLPNYWQASERDALAPLLDWNLLGAERLAQIVEWIAPLANEDLSKFLGRDSQARWEAIVQRAIESSRSFEEALRTPPVRPGSAPTRLGQERWLRLAQAASGSTLELPKLKWRILGYLADLEQLYGKSWRSKRTPAPMDNPLQHVRSVGAAASAFLDKAGMLGEFELPKISARFSERKNAPLPFHTLFTLRPGNRLHLVLDPSLEAMERTPLTALVLRKALPQAWFSGANALRQSRALAEGWELYVLDWPLRIAMGENDLAAIPGLKEHIAHLQVIEAARLLAAMELHTEGLSAVEAGELYAQRTGLPLAGIPREIQAATLDPLHGIGFLVWVELRALERALGDDQEAISSCLELSQNRPELRPADILKAVRPAEEESKR